MTIWKFPIEIADVTSVNMPVDAKILCLQMQHGVPCLWAEVDPTAPMVRRMFRFVGTGRDVADDLGPYIGTIQSGDGFYVFHLYER